MEAMIAAIAALAGKMIEQGDKDAANNLMWRAYDQFGAIAIPQIQKAVAEQLGPSAAGQLEADPAMRTAQMQALNKLQDVSDSGGMTLADQAALNKVGNRTARHEASGRNAITNNMDARGIGGSGAELALMMGNSQASNQRMSEEGADTAGRAERRALDAIMQRGRLAGQMRSQDWDERSSAARARDEMERWNAGARERANHYNLGAQQQGFENQMRKAGAQRGYSQSMANTYRQDGADNRNFVTGMGAVAAKGVKDYYDYQDDQEKDDRWQSIEDAWNEEDDE